jgi:lysine 6-dehydrogenase
MGGNEDIVLSQLSLNQSAQKAGISIIPDCGMGPGLTVSLAAYGISLLEEAHEVFIWDGGLPQNPEPPWNYKLTFHINGLTNEYDGNATFLRDGEIVKIPSLSEIEEIEFQPLGKLEAFVTSGGATTAILSYKGKLKTFQNKTLRYPGHYDQFRSYKLLGLFNESAQESGRFSFIPRDIFHNLLEPSIKAPPNFKDICVIRVLVRGKKEGKFHECVLEILDRYDEKTNFTAMERLTGYHTSILLSLSVKKLSNSGISGPELAINPPSISGELKKRNINVSIKI